MGSMQIGWEIVAFVFGCLFSSLNCGDIGYEGLYQDNAENVMPPRCFDMHGLPHELQGTFLIGGPAVFGLGGEEFQTVFDGYGKMNQFRLQDGHVCFAAVMLDSDFYNRSLELGHVAPSALFHETIPPRSSCPMLHPMCNIEKTPDNNWVNSWKLDQNSGRVMLLTDTVNMLDFDLETMTAIGLHPFADHLIEPVHMAQVGSAHPMPDGQGGFIEVGMEMGMTNIVVLYRVSADDPNTRHMVAKYGASSSPYMHSFGLTENYAIMPHNVHLDVMALMEARGAIIGPALKGGFDGVYVVDLSTAKKSGEAEITHFMPEPFYHVHVVNSFENDTGIVFDVCTFKADPFQATNIDLHVVRNKTLRDSANIRSLIKRYHFHMKGDKKGTTTEEPISLSNQSLEFPKINPNFNARPYCIYYANEWFHDGKTYAAMAVARHDICKGERTYWQREDWFPAEPFFVPHGDVDDESKGFLLVVVLNGRTQKSHFVVLDAATMTLIADVELPTRIPFLGHGEFFPDKVEIDQRTRSSFWV